MVKKAISKMKSGKAACTSDIHVVVETWVEMFEAAGDTGATMIHDLASVIICEIVMEQSKLTWSKVSLPAFTWAWVMLWTEALYPIRASP